MVITSPEEVTMFDVYCPVHERTVLLPVSRLRFMNNTDDGIVLLFECYDGALIEVVTGRAAAPVPG